MTAWMGTAFGDLANLPLIYLLAGFLVALVAVRFGGGLVRAGLRRWSGSASTAHLRRRQALTPAVGRIILGAVLVGVLLLLGFRPVGAGLVADLRSHDVVLMTFVIADLVLTVLLSVVTLLKGKLWTTVVGVFVPIILVVGSVRLARPRSLWAQWFYSDHVDKLDRALARDHRYARPVARWELVIREFLSGRLGVPDRQPPLPVASPTTLPSEQRRANAVAAAIRWRRTRHRLSPRAVWRAPSRLVSVSILLAIVSIAIDDTYAIDINLNTSTTATLLGVIAGAMATLTGLVFTAVTLAMQFGASQLSVRVVPMLQSEPIMRWSVGMFLATFSFTVIIAFDLTTSDSESSAPGLSTGIALVLTIAAAYLFISLIARVGSILNSTQVLRWILNEGRAAVQRTYPADLVTGERPDLAEADAVLEAAGDAADVGQPTMVVTLRESPANGRVLLAINLPRLQTLALRWDVRIDLLIGVGDYLPHNAEVFEIRGDRARVRPRILMRCLLFGDAHRPSVSPAAALQSISDVALKALSPAINDPSRAVQALDHVEDLLLMLAPRVHADARSTELNLVRNYRRSWADYVGISTDQVRHYGHDSVQVQRRLRALYETLIDHCPDDQHPPMIERLAVLDADVDTLWHNDFDRRLARASDRQGYANEAGRSSRVRRLAINAATSEAPQS